MIGAGLASNSRLSGTNDNSCALGHIGRKMSDCSAGQSTNHIPTPESAIIRRRSSSCQRRLLISRLDTQAIYFDWQRTSAKLGNTPFAEPFLVRHTGEGRCPARLHLDSGLRRNDELTFVANQVFHCGLWNIDRSSPYNNRADFRQQCAFQFEGKSWQP